MSPTSSPTALFPRSPLGDPLRYLLTDGTWAWGAARHIDGIGAAPRWC